MSEHSTELVAFPFINYNWFPENQSLLKGKLPRVPFSWKSGKVVVVLVAQETEAGEYVSLNNIVRSMTLYKSIVEVKRVHRTSVLMGKQLSS